MGMIRKIQLLSENLCYGPMPEENEEIEQRLTILSDGRAWLSRYCFGTGNPYRLKSREAKSIGKISAVKILSVIEACFVRDFIPAFATDIGSWELKLTFDNGDEYSFGGSLFRDDRIETLHISDMIRTAMGDPSLFAFDGGEEEYEELETMDYGEVYRNQTGRDFETGEIVVQ